MTAGAGLQHLARLAKERRQVALPQHSQLGRSRHRGHGHRGPHEIEVSLPRPAEDPAWIDRQMEGLRQVDVDALLARQATERAAAWERFKGRHPRQAPNIARRLSTAAEAARGREAIRSEVVRVYWALREFARRASALTGLGDEVFFLSHAELLVLLKGDRSSTAYIRARRATHARYSALPPPYPALISGRFDPFRWAADPGRRSDFFDAHQPPAPAAGATGCVRGFPGAAGVVEGPVRVLQAMEDGAALQAGEILVTASTNVGWTPLFPRAAAVVTDVGAPLSHAAIVARELRLPAAVGCGDATLRLKTGDRVRVNGGLGIVEVLA